MLRNATKFLDLDPEALSQSLPDFRQRAPLDSLRLVYFIIFIFSQRL